MILLKWLIWRKKFHFSTLFCELQFWKMILLEHLQKLIFVQIYFLHSCNSVSMAFDQSEICPFFFFKWWRILKKGQKEKKNILFFFSWNHRIITWMAQHINAWSSISFSKVLKKAFLASLSTLRSAIIAFMSITSETPLVKSTRASDRFPPSKTA